MRWRTVDYEIAKPDLKCEDIIIKTDWARIENLPFLTDLEKDWIDWVHEENTLDNAAIKKDWKIYRIAGNCVCEAIDWDCEELKPFDYSLFGREKKSLLSNLKDVFTKAKESGKDFWENLGGDRDPLQKKEQGIMFGLSASDRIELTILDRPVFPESIKFSLSWTVKGAMSLPTILLDPSNVNSILDRYQFQIEEKFKDAKLQFRQIHFSTG